MKLAKIDHWRGILRNNFTKWELLAKFLELDEQNQTFLLKHSHFSLNVPYRLAEKIKKGTLNDPILRQFLPLIEEKKSLEGFSTDPVGDMLCKRSGKLLHKYQGRCLLITTSACAMHCRFCFRQNFPYETVRKEFEEELKLISEDSSLKEVILSGGDPLSLSNEMLKNLMDDLSLIPHIRRIRFHTRFPIGIPERLDKGFLSLIETSPFQFFFVIHCNHAKELDVDVIERLKALQKLNVVLLCQSVLLKGVNDDISALVELCNTLVDHGITPYYVHQLDRVKGAAHFEVSEEKGKALMAELRKRVSGYALPRYVKEIAGEPHKTEIAF